MKAPERHYRWSGLRAGQARTGQLQASSIHMARALLEREGITVQRIARRWIVDRQSVNASAVVTMTRQWATLMQAGVHLVPALQMLASSQRSPVLRGVLEQVRQQIEAGLPLTRALATHPRCFGPLYLGLIEAGEAAGRLPLLMGQLADTLEQQETLRKRLRAAMTYPMTVLGMAALALVVMLVWVVPVFEEVFHSFGSALPAATQAVLGLSRALVQWGPWLALPAGAGIGFFWRLWPHSRAQQWWQRQWLHWPVIGAIGATGISARWAQALGTLLAAGIPLAEALPVAGQTCAHPLYLRVTAHLQRRVQQGDRLSLAMADSGRFTPLLVQLCATGEETGTLHTLLTQAATIQTQALQSQLMALSALLEPLTVLLLGGAIGGILVAMYLPIFQLGQVF